MNQNNSRSKHHSSDDEQHQPTNARNNDENENSSNKEFADVGTAKTKGSGKPIQDIQSSGSALTFRKAPKSRGLHEDIQAQKAEIGLIRKITNSTHHSFSSTNNNHDDSCGSIGKSSSIMNSETSGGKIIGGTTRRSLPLQFQHGQQLPSTHNSLGSAVSCGGHSQDHQHNAENGYDTPDEDENEEGATTRFIIQQVVRSSNANNTEVKVIPSPQTKLVTAFPKMESSLIKTADTSEKTTKQRTSSSELDF